MIERPEEATRQLAPGTTQPAPDDPKAVSATSTSGVFAAAVRPQANLMSEATATGMPNTAVSTALTRSGQTVCEIPFAGDGSEAAN
jgi:hypothetical protein